MAELTSSSAGADAPRSSRVAQSTQSGYKATNAAHGPSSPPQPGSPPLPPRSPLRPRNYRMSIDTRSSTLSSQESSLDYGSDNTSMTSMNSLSHARSFGSLSTVVGPKARMGDKPLPILPPSPLPEGSADGEESLRSAPSSLHLSASCPTSKRHHALLELLTSERSYSTDLCLIRDLHMSLALGALANPFVPKPSFV
jgi:dynamin-binding protein